MSNQWLVRKLDRNWNRVLGETYVRAMTEQRAMNIGRVVLGDGGVILATPYDASRDLAMAGYVRVVDALEGGA